MHGVQLQTPTGSQVLQVPEEVLFVTHRFTGDLRYHLQNGWFIDHDEPRPRRRRHARAYSLWEPGDSRKGTANHGAYASLEAAIEAACRLSPALRAWRRPSCGP